MSGGHFDYWQYHIGSIAEQIEDLIKNNNEADEYGDARNFNKETLSQFRKAVKILKIAEIYAQRVDWLVSGDDGEETFMERLKEDLAEIKVNPLDLLVIPTFAKTDIRKRYDQICNKIDYWRKRVTEEFSYEQGYEYGLVYAEKQFRNLFKDGEGNELDNKSSV